MSITLRKCFFFVCILILKNQAFAQSNFVPAIVINNNGDSVKGQIDYRNWKKNPETITFTTASNERQKFDASTIRGFYIPAENEVYTSYDVEVDMKPGDSDDAIKNELIDSLILHKRVFLLQVMSSPVVRLYQYTDNNKDHYYFVKGDGAAVELMHSFSYDELSKVVTENQKFREQMAALFVDCPAVNADINRIKYNSRDIESSFSKYVQCKAPGTSVATVKKESAGTMKIGIVAGVSSSHYDFQGDEELIDDNYSSSVTPLFGASLDIGLPRRRDQWHFVNELLYKSYNTSSTFTRPYNYSYTRTSDVKLGFSYIQLNTLFRYMYPSGGTFRPFINFGFGNAFMVAENENSLHVEYSFGRVEDMKAIDGPKKYEFSLLGGIGVKIRRIEIEFRYMTSQKGFSPYNNLDVNTTSLQGLLVYRF